MSRPRHSRPGFVTRLCNSLLLYGLFGLILSGIVVFNGFSMEPKDDAAPWVKALLVAASLLLIVCGIYMSKGANWARILFYITCAPVILAVRSAVVMHNHDNADAVPAIVVSFLFMAGYCIALSLERANRFFTGRGTFFKEEDSGSRGGRGGGSGSGGQRQSGRSFDY